MVPFILATIPLVASIIIVNALFYPGATDVILDLGPVALTGTGLTAALQASTPGHRVRAQCRGVLAHDADR